MSNDHYLTRSLIKPWCYKNLLCTYFDFKSKEICRNVPIKTNFCAKNMNDQNTESSLNKYLEDSFIKFRKRIFKDENFKILSEEFNEKFTLSNWKEYRSLYLYFFIQIFRYDKYHHFINNKSELTLDDFLNKGETFLDLFVQKLIDDNKKIIIFSVPHPYQFFLPDQGLFIFPFKDNDSLSGYSFGFISPITPFYGIAMCNVATDFKDFFESEDQRILTSYFSTYNSKKKIKLILPPKVINFSDNEIIESIEEMNSTAEKIFITLKTS